MDLTVDIQKIQENFYLTYLNNLVKACDKNNINSKMILEKINELKEKKDVDDLKNKEEAKLIVRNTSKNSLVNLSTNTDSPTSATATNQFSDDYLYQKPWTKLTAIHKIIKIKEFVNSLLIKEANEKTELKEKIINLIKNKTLTKKDSVLYDPVKGKIISIPSLQFKNGKYII